MHPDHEIYLFLNEPGNKDKMRPLFRAQSLTDPQE